MKILQMLSCRTKHYLLLFALQLCRHRQVEVRPAVLHSFAGRNFAAAGNFAWEFWNTFCPSLQNSCSENMHLNKVTKVWSYEITALPIFQQCNYSQPCFSEVRMSRGIGSHPILIYFALYFALPILSRELGGEGEKTAVEAHFERAWLLFQLQQQVHRHYTFVFVCVPPA